MYSDVHRILAAAVGLFEQSDRSLDISLSKASNYLKALLGFKNLAVYSYFVERV